LGTVKLFLLSSGCLLAALVASLVVFHAETGVTDRDQAAPASFKAGGMRSFDIVPLETVSETSSNASIGDLNGDGHPDIVLANGRHWQVTSRVFFGDGKGHFRPGPALPSKAIKSYSASLADMTGSGHLDMVLSNDQPDPKLVLLNDGKGHFTIGGRYGDPKWSTRNAAVGDLNGDGHPDIAVANREMTSFVCFNDGKLNFDCRPLADSPSAATVVIADMNGDGATTSCMSRSVNVVYFNDGGELRSHSELGTAEVIHARHGGSRRRRRWTPGRRGVSQVGCFVYLNDSRALSKAVSVQKPKACPIDDCRRLEWRPPSRSSWALSVAGRVFQRWDG
jgi:hypothetical protein